MLDRSHPLSKIEVGSDHVAHALFAFTLTLAATLAVPRIRPLLIGGLFFAAGAIAEWVQHLGLVPGEYGLGDLIANAAGIAAAVLPMAVSDLRRRLREAPPARADL